MLVNLQQDLKANEANLMKEKDEELKMICEHKINAQERGDLDDIDFDQIRATMTPMRAAKQDLNKSQTVNLQCVRTTERSTVKLRHSIKTRCWEVYKEAGKSRSLEHIRRGPEIFDPIINNIIERQLPEHKWDDYIYDELFAHY